MKNGKIESFTDLNVWIEGHKFVIMIHEITKSFPKAETYSLIDQLRRAVASITANIAEGFGRQTYKEKIQFYYIAKGSLAEVKNFLFIARDIGYISSEQFAHLMHQATIVDKLLQGFIKKSKTFITIQ